VTEKKKTISSELFRGGGGKIKGRNIRLAITEESNTCYQKALWRERAKEKKKGQDKLAKKETTPAIKSSGEIHWLYLASIGEKKGGGDPERRELKRGGPERIHSTKRGSSFYRHGR